MIRLNFDYAKNFALLFEEPDKLQYVSLHMFNCSDGCVCSGGRISCQVSSSTPKI